MKNKGIVFGSAVRAANVQMKPMNPLGAFLLSILAAQGAPVESAQQHNPETTVAIVREIPSADRRRAEMKVILAGAEEARRLGLNPKEIYLVRPKGTVRRWPLQWDERTKEPYFLLPTLAAGEKLEVEVLPVGSFQAEIAVEHAYMQEQLWMTTLADGVQRRLFAFQHDELLPPGIKPVYRRAGFIHPVLTPSGQVISGSFAPDHAHHHGIWTAWSHTEFQGRHPDFWNVHEETGRVEYLGLGPRWIGPVDSGFTATMRSLDTRTDPATEVLAETWRVTTLVPRPGATETIFELETTQRNVAKDPLTLTKHIYGGLGFRGLPAWTVDAPLTFVTSEGQVGRKAGDGQRVRWFAFAGPTAQGRGGIAILAHPDNVNFPQWTRFNPKDPFVAFTPVHDGPLTIKPEETLTQRFRFVVFDGEPDLARLEDCWQGFARPPRATGR